VSAEGSDLERVKALVDFEVFRPALEVVVVRADRSKGGRPAFDHVLMYARPIGARLAETIPGLKLIFADDGEAPAGFDAYETLIATSKPIRSAEVSVIANYKNIFVAADDASHRSEMIETFRTHQFKMSPPLTSRLRSLHLHRAHLFPVQFDE